MKKSNLKKRIFASQQHHSALRQNDLMFKKINKVLEKIFFEKKIFGVN